MRYMCLFGLISVVVAAAAVAVVGCASLRVCLQVIRNDGGEFKVTSSYLFPSREVFEHYVEKVAPELRADGVQRFSNTGKAVLFERTIGEVAFQC